MDENDFLDTAINEVNKSKFSKLSIRALLSTLVLIILTVLLTLVDSENYFIQYLNIFILLGFIASSIAGFIFMIRSITRREPDTLSKILGAIGNIFFFIVLLGLLSFMVMDMMQWFTY